MCVKLLSGDLKSSSYTPHLINTYTCGVTTTPNMRGSSFNKLRMRVEAELLIIFHGNYYHWTFLFHLCLCIGFIV